MAPPFVRLYDSSRDYDNGLHVFFATIEKSLDYEPARTIGSHLWYKPYVQLTPSTCFVLDDGAGRVVGYCIGTPNTSAFAQQWRDEYVPTIDAALIPRPEIQTGDPFMEREECKSFRGAAYHGGCSMLLEWPELLKSYPAHMHIDILPEYQRKGYGTVLINKLFEAVKTAGAEALHLNMGRHNVKAKAFYERIGFEVIPHVLDGGESGEKGVSDGVLLTLVKKL